MSAKILSVSRARQILTAATKTRVLVKSREKISFGFYHTMLMNASHK